MLTVKPLIFVCGLVGVVSVDGLNLLLIHYIPNTFLEPALETANGSSPNLLLCRVVKSAGPKGHILNLGHGVLVKTPEEAVAHFFDVTRSLRYDTLFQGCVTEVLEPVA